MQNNKSILKTANEAIAIGDIEAFLTFCDDDIHWLTVGEEAIVGKEAVRRWMKKEYVQPPRFSVTDMVAEGDLVVAIGEIEAEGSDGEMATYTYSDVWRFRNGKMVELRAFVVVA